MIIQGKITKCDVHEKEKVNDLTGEKTVSKWANYVISYLGHYPETGKECTRTLAFTVIGRDRLNKLKILEGQWGKLDIESYSSEQTSMRTGGKYWVTDWQVLSWTPDEKKNPKPVTPSNGTQTSILPQGESSPRPIDFTTDSQTDLPF